MLSHHDELELLAIIEGELDDDRLAADPPVRALVAAMRRDREMLRTEPEPQIPHDLAAKIEQALTRPMLIAAWGEDDPAADPSLPQARQRGIPAARPGEFRRHHHRPARLRRIVRFALAASIGVLLIGGLWLGVNTALDWRTDRQRMLAQQERDRAIDEARAVAATDETWPTDGSAIHHYAPQPVLERHLAGRAPLDSMPSPRQPSITEPVAVEFALFIATTEPALVEASLKELIGARGASVAMVQHMSRAEARRILDEFHASRSPDSTGAPLQPPQPASAAPRTLAGSRALAPSFGQQLDYAVRGATHTITIRLSQLAALLEEIDRMTIPGAGPGPGSGPESGAAMAGGTGAGALRPLPDIIAADRRRNAAADWIKSRSIVREAIAQLEETGEDPLIHLPVVIE